MEIYAIQGIHVHRCADIEEMTSEDTLSNIMFSPDPDTQENVLYMERTKGGDFLIAVGGHSTGEPHTVLIPMHVAEIMFKAMMLGIPGGVHIIEDITPIPAEQTQN